MWHEHLTHLSNSPVRCIHFILRHFSTVLFLHILYYLVISEKKQLLYCSFAVYLLLFSTSLYLYTLLLCLGTLQKERLYREPAILTSCGSSLLWHGLISAEHGYDAISGKKDWKHVSVQNVITLNTCCAVACQTFQLPHHNQFFLEPPMPTHSWLFSEPLFSELLIFEGTQQAFCQVKKFCMSHVIVVIFWGGVGKLVTVFFWQCKSQERISNTVENDFFGLPKVKWLHLTGEMDKSVGFSCQIFSGFNIPKIIIIG